MGRKALPQFLRRDLLAEPAALAIFFEEEAGRVWIGIGIARPARDQFLQPRPLAGFPAGALLFQEPLLYAAGSEKVSRSRQPERRVVVAARGGVGIIALGHGD